MFSHIYKYRMKCILRNKQLLFWTMIFPIFLAILFQLALTNITKGVDFEKITVAIVNNAQLEEKVGFKEAMESVSNQNGEKIFNVKYIKDKKEGEVLLDNKKIQGYIKVDDGIKIVIPNGGGLNETILKSFVDNYEQTISSVTNLIKENPEKQQEILKEATSNKEFIQELPINKGVSNPVTVYFYTVIAMACLYGSFWGLNEVGEIQGNMSSRGIRVNVAPIKKLKAFSVSILAAFTVQFIEILLLLLFLILILKVDFGNQIPYILITCLVGTITGISMGTLIGSFKVSEGMKIGISIGSTMTMCFFAGMMQTDIKYFIQNNIPILGYINPANLITDSFYSLFYLSSYERFFFNIVMLCIISGIFSTITFLKLRRQKYASL